MLKTLDLTTDSFVRASVPDGKAWYVTNVYADDNSVIELGEWYRSTVSNFAQRVETKIYLLPSDVIELRSVATGSTAATSIRYFEFDNN